MKKKTITVLGISTLLLAGAPAAAFNQDFTKINEERWDYKLDVGISEGLDDSYEQTEWTTPAALYYSIAETDQMVQQILGELNQEREKAGLEKWTLNSEYSLIASAKAKDMYYNQYFDQVSPTYGTPEEMFSIFGHDKQNVLQLIQTGETKPEQVISQWKSNKEAQQIESGQVGISVFGEKNTDKLYWVLVATE